LPNSTDSEMYCTVLAIYNQFQFQKVRPTTSVSRILYHTGLTPMNKTSTKKRPNRKPALAALATKKRLSLGNTSTSKPHKKTRKNTVSHQQTIQARDTLDAEYRDWRTEVAVSSVLDPVPFQVLLSSHYNHTYCTVTSASDACVSCLCLCD
jgi:hypothetical protein